VRTRFVFVEDVNRAEDFLTFLTAALTGSDAGEGAEDSFEEAVVIFVAAAAVLVAAFLFAATMRVVFFFAAGLASASFAIVFEAADWIGADFFAASGADGIASDFDLVLEACFSLVTTDANVFDFLDVETFSGFFEVDGTTAFFFATAFLRFMAAFLVDLGGIVAGEITARHLGSQWFIWKWAGTGLRSDSPREDAGKRGPAGQFQTTSSLVLILVHPWLNGRLDFDSA